MADTTSSLSAKDAAAGNLNGVIGLGEHGGGLLHTPLKEEAADVKQVSVDDE